MSTENVENAENVQIDVVAETEKVLDTVMQSDWQMWLNDWIIPYGSKLLLAVAIYYGGKWMARLLSRLIGKMVLISTKDEMLQSFVTSISYFLFLLIVIIAALSQLGVNTSSLVALIGAAGLAVGLALQGSLQNFASGVMLLIFKPFKKGDFIEVDGVAGKVEQMGLLLLELRTNDNKSILLPNNSVFGGKIVNYSRNETRRIDLIFDIAYESDIAQAKAIVAEVLKNEPRVLQDPEPVIAVGSLAASSVQIFARPWVQTCDYAATNFALIEEVKLAFDKAGISIPYNQMDLHFPEGSIQIQKK